MPTTKFQKLVFALITVVITVHLFVFYNLSYVNGFTIAQLEEFGVPVLGHSFKIWAVILTEFICAYLLEIFVGSPCSLKLALRVVNPRENKPYMVETAIICATVGLMCPMMSFIATYSGPLCQDKNLKKYREPDITISVSLSRVGWRFAEQILPDLDNVPLGILGVRRMVCPFPVIA